MRIAFLKTSNERYELSIVRDDGTREASSCEIRSTLNHDLLHYAVEAEARLDGGFYGCLARGRTLAEMNDRSAPWGQDAELAAIEQLVGALHGATKGADAAELVTGMRRFAAALDATLPEWLTEGFVERVLERMRRLQGEWRATPFGAEMKLPWPAP